MPPRTKEGSTDLGSAIRQRRCELGLSAEEAARRAGVGAKTWFRYESGSSIRSDKVKGVCRALSWASLPAADEGSVVDEDCAWLESVDCSHAAWSKSLNEAYGRKAAVSFAVGSDILFDYLTEDLEELRNNPAGTHLGELASSWLADMLPQQFMMKYDFEFVFRLRAALASYRARAHFGEDVYAHTPAEELLVRLIRDVSFDAVDGWSPSATEDASEVEEFQNAEGWRDWPEDLCDDIDLEMALSDTGWVSEGDSYHFDRWFEPQFYLECSKTGSSE